MISYRGCPALGLCNKGHENNNLHYAMSKTSLKFIVDFVRCCVRDEHNNYHEYNRFAWVLRHKS